MKLTFLTYTYPYPERGFNPGIERVVESLSQKLARMGHNIHVVTTYGRNNGKKEEEIIDKVKIHRIKDMRDILGKMGSIFSLDLLSISHSVKKYKHLLYDSDVIHTFTPFLIDIPDIPLVSHLHHPEKIRNIKECLYLPSAGYLWRGTYKRSDGVVSVSKYSARYLTEIGIPQSKIFVVPNGIDIDRFHPRIDAGKLKNRLGRGNILLYVGPIIKRKGLRYLVEAMPKILLEYEDTILLLVGNGDQKRNLKRLSHELGVSSKVIFEGFVSEEQLPMYYNACDLFVFPSLQEGFGMALAEAMACGKTVVATNTTAIPEVVGDAGVLVEPKNMDALAEAIIDLLSDEDKRKNLEQNAYKRVQEKFTWEQAAEKTVKLYEGLLSS